ncbi:MAG: hypothetical protein ABI286_06345 [Edaphobacter sp.]
MDRSAIGAAIGIAFGCLWGVVGSSGLPTRWRSTASFLSIGISTALCVAILMIRAHPQALTFRGKIYLLAVLFEVVAIVVAINLLKYYNRPDLLLPAVGFIVGLHFFGLWKAANQSIFLWIAAAMCVLCAISAFLPTATEPNGLDLRRVTTGLGCAVVLWTSCLSRFSVTSQKIAAP